MSDADRLQRDRERMKRAAEQDARDVERLYSTRPIRVRLAGREYLIPVNHLTPKGKEHPDHLDAKEYFGFYLFLPDYGGFTKANWQKGWFEPSRIDVLQISPVDKNAIIPILGGGSQRIQPANYGEPRSGFENLRPSLEQEPAFKLYGLEGFRWKNRRQGMTWTGTRSNGEFFFFTSTLAPDEASPYADHFPHCDVRYYSEREDLFIAYSYPQDHIAKWREIDDAIWQKLHAWRVK